MSELRTIEREVEEKVHSILHELEAQLKGIFGTQPQISQSIAEAKKKVSSITTPPRVIETKTYADGSTATGVASLPDHSPVEQEDTNHTATANEAIGSQSSDNT